MYVLTGSQNLNMMEAISQSLAGRTSILKLLPFSYDEQKEAEILPDNVEEQIFFELFKVIQNNFVINKCENCGRLFIPATTNNNPYQKARNEQKYCNNLYLDTGKTCKEIGATNKHKEKKA